MASAKQHRTSTDCSDDGWVGGVDCGSYWTGWLPHLTDQSNKQNVPTAVPKIRQVRLCAMEALPVCRPAIEFQAAQLPQMMPEGSAASQSQLDMIMLTMVWLCKEPYSELQQGTIRRPELTATGNIFSFRLFTAKIRTHMLLEKRRREAELMYRSCSVPVNLHMMLWCSTMTHIVQCDDMWHLIASSPGTLILQVENTLKKE